MIDQVTEDCLSVLDYFRPNWYNNLVLRFSLYACGQENIVGSVKKNVTLLFSKLCSNSVQISFLVLKKTPSI